MEIQNPRLSEADIRRNYAHHRPANRDVELAHSHVREILADAAVALNKVVPEGRHKSLMHTALEEARLWANTAVAVPPASAASDEPPAAPTEAGGQ